MLDTLWDYQPEISADPLFDENGLINKELAQALIDNYGNKLVGQTKETLEELIKLREKYDEYIEQLHEYVSSCCKTYHSFLLIENKELTKIVSLTGNDLETSRLLYSAMFCINQKNAFLICKNNVFLPYNQSYSSEK